MRRILLGAALTLALSACGGGDEQGGATADDQAAAPASNDTAPAAETTPAPEASAEPVAYDPASGPPQAFTQCAVCHSVEPGKQMIGPSLHGIYGEKAGDVEGYTFSKAMLDSGLTWDDETLDTYLQNPRKMVPGTKMSYAGLRDDAKRQEVITYIKYLSE
ncbi:c-type cytochrome [Altericroceibacterium endophyticum]|uniref:C-type cytochrome n=1 Tax=Altericroceibacterium endophyticum TaxID=1808508 RepID=A0A6I4T601_9SPHN|nr:cytochrome c family protein [Altericroceibacterium endophyticum]MXO65433.1 c-type cytochrome [Altericroceibacterium endophyticum]